MFYCKCLFSFIFTIYKTTQSIQTWVWHPSECSCAITTFTAPWTLMQPCYPGGSPYGSSQSDADGIAATSVLMRSSFALMSDSKRWAAQQSARQHTIACVHTVHMHNYCMSYCLSIKLCRHVGAVYYILRRSESVLS